MLYVYATCQIKAGKEIEFEQIAQKMVKGTLQEPNVVHYSCGKVQGKPRTYAFVETWHSLADQQAHFALPHIQDNLPALSAILEGELNVEFIDQL